MTIFLKFSNNFIRHISTSMTSWQKIFCMRTVHGQYASHTKSWPNAYGYLWRLGPNTSEGAKNHDHSVITPPSMNQS